MSPSHHHPCPRSIAQLGVETPLVIPSFSSRGFSELATLFSELRNDLYGVCLVSAFDLSTKRLTARLGDVADLVILDSGVYETKAVAVAADGYQPPPAPETWTRGLYREYLRTVHADANVLAVSFDHYGAITEQIELANEDFAHAPTAASDFLMKPHAGEEMIDLGMVRKRTAELSRFQVVGVTERELGDSLLDRCRSVAKLRDALSAEGANVPIHVFGTITPGVVLAYFLCGADLFDGLNWIRFAYGIRGLRSIPETALDDGEWSQPDDIRVPNQLRQNLRFLHRLQSTMRSYTRSGNLAALIEAFPIGEAAAQVAAAAGGRFSAARSVLP